MRAMVLGDIPFVYVWRCEHVFFSLIFLFFFSLSGCSCISCDISVQDVCIFSCVRDESSFGDSSSPCRSELLQGCTGDPLKVGHALPFFLVQFQALPCNTKLSTMGSFGVFTRAQERCQMRLTDPSLHNLLAYKH